MKQSLIEDISKIACMRLLKDTFCFFFLSYCLFLSPFLYMWEQGDWRYLRCLLMRRRVPALWPVMLYQSGSWHSSLASFIGVLCPIIIKWHIRAVTEFFDSAHPWRFYSVALLEYRVAGAINQYLTQAPYPDKGSSNRSPIPVMLSNVMRNIYFLRIYLNSSGDRS